jgi:hypothetical protein
LIKFQAARSPPSHNLLMPGGSKRGLNKNAGMTNGGMTLDCSELDND